MRARAWLVLAVVLTAGAPAGFADEAPGTLFSVAFVGDPGVAPGDSFHGGVVEKVSPALGLAAVRAGDRELFALRAGTDPRVRWVEPVTTVSALGHEGPPRHGARASGQYALDQVGVPAASTSSAVGGTAVCFVDSGFDRHDDVDAALVRARANFVDPTKPASDALGHGTFVVGVVAADSRTGLGVDGIARVPVYVAKAIADSGTGTTSDVADGIAWCADRPEARLVVSLSLGTRTASRTLQAAVQYAEGRGRLVVAAAGNEGCDGCVLFPAAFPEVVAVACTARFEQRCRFSSVGPEVELAAPGASVLGLASDGRSYVAASGTSVSAPHVAGAAALAWDRHPTATADAVRKLLHATAQRLPGMAEGDGRDAKFGHGELDVACLLSGSSSSSACDPPSPPPSCAPADAFGYRCFASAALARPPDAVSLDDPGHGPVALGTVVDFYGLKYDRVFVSPAGVVTFGGACASPCKPSAVPSPESPDGLVAAGWTDSPAGRVLMSRQPSTGDVFLEWFEKAGDVTPRAVLAIRNASGDLAVNASGVPGGLVGIEDPSGGTGMRSPTATVVFASPGTAPPGPPEGLVAQPRAGVTSWIDLAWEVPSSGAYGVQRYEVWRSVDPAHRGVLLGFAHDTRFADDVERSCEDCPTRGRTDSFHYSVRAVGPGGRGPYASTCAGLVPLVACAAPGGTIP